MLNLKWLTCLVSCALLSAGVAFAADPAPAAPPATPAAPASAGADEQPVDELLEDVKDPTCGEALKSCKADGVGPAWQKARTGCAALRTCKKDCRGAAGDVKGEARDTFKDCKDACKGDKACAKACKKDKRADKKDAREAKRDCNGECRTQFKTPECKEARKELGKALLACAKKAGGPCVKALEELTSDE